MFEALLAGISMFFTPVRLLFTIIGVIIGLIIGILPGIGILPAMAIVLPLTYGMNPAVALNILIAIQAVGVTGGSITACLLNIPGESANSATILDGFPLTKKGQGGRAVGAALCASASGGAIGGIWLALLIPVAYSVALLFGSGETALMGLLGLTFISVLSRGSIIKGFISGFAGIALSFIGIHAVTGTLRYTFGNLYLYEGIQLVPFVVGLFALPEVFSLIAKRGGTIAEVDESVLKQTGWKQVSQGVLDVYRHWSIHIRCALLGSVVGMVPGVGGVIASFLAYGHAKQTSKDPDSFGKGNIEGVIAPETANNAKEGGNLIPTLAFGIPGSVPMTILLAAFLIHGIQPVPSMLTQHLDLTWSMVMGLIFSNIIGVLFVLPFISTFAKIAFVRGQLLIPIILVIAVFGAYAANTEFIDIITSFVFGILGYAMMKSGYERINMVLGFILGRIVERYLSISIESMGAAFLLRPTSFVLVLMIVLLLAYKPVKDYIQKRKRTA